MSPRDGEHRHTHPHRLQAGGAAVVGHGVEGDVYIGVLGHHVAQAARAAKLQAVQRHTELLEALHKHLDRCFVFEAGRFEHQAGVGHSLQHLGPQGQGAWREFGHVVERRKGQRSLGVFIGEPGKGIVLFWGVAKHRVWQTNDLLGEQGLAALGGHHGVSHDPIHLRHTRRPWVAQEGGLHRRCTLGKQGHALHAGVTSQVHQHIDAIFFNAPCQLNIVQGGDLYPLADAAFGQQGLFVVTHTREIHRQLNVLRIPSGQHRLHEDVDRVLMVEIGGDQTQAQALVGLAWVGKTVAAASALAHGRKQLAVQSGDSLGGKLIAVERGHGGAGTHFGQRAFFLGQFGIDGQRLVHLAQTTSDRGS